MPLTNCKIELKLKWINHYVLSAAGNDNVKDNVNANNIVFTIKGKKLYTPVWFYQQKTIKNYQNFLAKDLKY